MTDLDRFLSKPAVYKWAHFLTGFLLVVVPPWHPMVGLAVSIAAAYAWEWGYWWVERERRKAKPLLTLRRGEFPKIRSDFVPADIVVGSRSEIGNSHSAGLCWRKWCITFWLHRCDIARPSAWDILPWAVGAVVGYGYALLGV